MREMCWRATEEGQASQEEPPGAYQVAPDVKARKQGGAFLANQIN